MSALAGGWDPLSVRRGIREPFRLVEGIPEHARPLINDWVSTIFRGPSNRDRDVRGLISTLQLPFHADYSDELVRALRGRDDFYLDVLDFLSFALPQYRDSLERELAIAGSAWKVDPESGRLHRRVPAEAQAAYELALEREPSAAEHLSGAWENAFGRHPDAGDAWSDAIKALEAVLSPIVIPAARLAKLSDIQSAVRAAPEGKFIIRAAGRNPRASLPGMLDSIPYEPGRHGSDHTTAELQTARIVVLQATAIVAAVGEGLIESPSSTSGNNE